MEILGLPLAAGALGLLIALVTALLLVPPIREVARRRRWTDDPDGERKRHSRPTPLLGGLAIVGGALAGLVYFALVQPWLDFEVATPPVNVWLGALLMIAAGVYDDVYGLGFKRKFGLQIIAAYLVIHAGYVFEVERLPFVGPEPYQQALWSVTLSVLWIVGVINAVNLIDGLDGLAAGVSLIALVCAASIFGYQGNVGLVVFALPLIGALAGFLVYNFNPATIFMGDSGSLFLGFILATYTLRSSVHVDPLIALCIPAVILGLPLLDTALAILRRAAAGKAVFAPDGDHIHHRLRARYTHRRAVLILYAMTAFFGLGAIAIASISTLYAYLILVLLLAFVGFGTHRLGYFDFRAAISGSSIRKGPYMEASSNQVVRPPDGERDAVPARAPADAPHPTSTGEEQGRHHVTGKVILNGHVSARKTT